MSAAPVSKFGFFEVRTSEVERLADYYEEALGLAVTERSDAAVYLTTGSDHHCVVVAEGEPDGRARLGFELEVGLDEAADALTAAGIENRRLTNPEPGITDAIEIHEAVTGTPIVRTGSRRLAAWRKAGRGQQNSVTLPATCRT